jgi:polysaccharide pyruvyl transferase CsaB
VKLLLSGYYGFGNIGDEAILAGILGYLQSRHKVTVLSDNPKATTNLHNVRATHRYFGAPKALFECDAFVSGGGGLLQDVTSRRSLIYYLGLIRWARHLGKPTATFGQSIGPLSSQGLRAVKNGLRDIPIAVRDVQSRELLAEVGIEAELAADPALLLSNLPAVAITKKSPPRGGPILLIPRAGHPDLTDVLAAIATTLAADAIPLATMALHSKQDDHELTRLCSKVPSLERWSAQDPLGALSKISSAGFVISVRLHGLVLAAVAGRGFAGLVYDPKVAGFLSEVGAPAFHRPIDSSTIVRIARNRPDPSLDKIATLTRRAHHGIRWLERVLSTPRTT